MRPSRAIRSTVKQVPTLLAVVAAVTLILTPSRTVGLVLAAAALAGLIARGVIEDFPRLTPAQLVLLFGVLSLFGSAGATGGTGVPLGTAGLPADTGAPVAGGDGPAGIAGLPVGAPSSFDLALALAATALTLVIVLQPILASVVNRPAMVVANLPGYRPAARAWLRPDALFAANAGLLGLAMVVGAAGWSAWLVVAPVAVVIAAHAAVGGDAVRRHWGGGRGDTRFVSAMARYRPAFALYFSAPDDTDYHVRMWLPYLERVGRPFVIIVRERRALAALSAVTAVPVVYCPSVSSVDRVVTPSIRACFYVNNGAKNAHMVRFGQMTHIQMLHGDSDKASSFNPVTAMFDRIFVAGQAGIDRYRTNGVPIPPHKFDIVGRPQVEDVEVSHDHVRDIIEKVVLYATTWIGLYTDANYCSLSVGERIVTELLARDVTVILRPHPYAERDQASARQIARLNQILAEDRDRTGRRHSFGAAATKQMSLIECMNAADALISDVSGVASDFLRSGKPFALTDMVGAGEEAFERSFPLARGAYVIDGVAANIAAVLDDLLEADPRLAVRREIKTYYLGDFGDTAGAGYAGGASGAGYAGYAAGTGYAGYADRFVACARAYVDAPVPEAAGVP